MARQLLPATIGLRRDFVGRVFERTGLRIIVLGYWTQKNRKREHQMSSVSTTNSATDLQLDYLKLLVTELQNQNPLEPMDNNQMASQLAQFSQLQQLESMNSNFASVLALTERSYANNLIGKEVSFTSQTETGEKVLTTGTVEKVIAQEDGTIILAVGDKNLALDDVVSVTN